MFTRRAHYLLVLAAAWLLTIGAAATCDEAWAAAKAKTCTFNGQTIQSGSSVTAYQSQSVPYGQTCLSQSRTCNNSGTLSGSYQYAACSVQPPASCTFNGQTIPSGSSVTAYSSQSVPYGQTCLSQTRTCTNGTLSGSGQYASCSVQAPASCTFNGQTIASGASVTAYPSSSVPYDQTCLSETRTCTNGTLSGSGQYASCSVLPPPLASCPFNGQTIASGSSVTAYPSQSVPYGQTCLSETRTCTDGTLSGSGPYVTCSALPAASCTFNGQTIASGSSVTAYPSASVPYGQTCPSETRTCSDGTLSGSAEYASCSVLPQAPLASLPYVWGRSGTGAGIPNEADGIAFDVAGNVYVSGVFNGSATFANAQTLTSAGLGDIFVMKLSPAGELLWLRQFGGIGDDNAYDVDTDPAGNLILSGWFADTLDLGGITLTSQGGQDQFVAKMSPDGDVLWARSFGSPADDGGNEVTTDANGNILVSVLSAGDYVAGGFAFQSAGSQDSYVLKLSPDGDILWVRGTTGTGKERLRALSVDAQGNVYGGFEFWNRFVIGGTAFSAPSPFFSDGAIVKWDADGNQLWAKQVTGSGNDNVRGLAPGPDGSVYATGSFGTAATIFGRPAASLGGTDTYLARLNGTDGSIMWLATLGSTGDEPGGELAANAAGRVALSTVIRPTTDTIISVDGVYRTTIPHPAHPENLLILFDPDNSIHSANVTTSATGAASSGTLSFLPDGSRTANGVRFADTITFGADSFTNPPGGEGFVIVINSDQ